MKTLLFSALLFLLSACSSTASFNNSAAIEAKPALHQLWQLKSITAKKYSPAVLTNSVFNLEHTDKAYAYMGCNHIALNYQLDSQLSFQTATITGKKCANNQLENDFLVTLTKIDHYEIVDNQLFLKKHDSVLMILEVKTGLTAKP